MFTGRDGHRAAGQAGSARQLPPVLVGCSDRAAPDGAAGDMVGWAPVADKSDLADGPNVDRSRLDLLPPPGVESTDDIGDRLAIPNGWGWRATGGLIGRFTERLVLNVLGGYGQIRYNEQSVIDESGGHPEASNPTGTGFDQDVKGIEGMLLTVELSSTPLLGHTVTGGYRKDFEDSWFTNYVHYHYVFARYQAVLGSRLGASLEAGYRREQFRGEVTRDDDFVRGSLGITYNAAEWLDVDLGTLWVRRVSADATPNAEIEYDNVMFSIGVKGIY